MADTIAARLRAAFSTIVEGMIELIEVVPIKANNREYTGIIIFVPEFSFGEVSAEARAKQVSIKRRYEHLAEVVRVLLGKAPDDLLRQWKEADEQFRVWIELESNWALERHREGNRAKLQTAAGAVEKILAVLGALGDHGVLLVPDTNSLIERPDPAAYRAVAGQEDFTFVLLPTVLGELDDLKISHKNPEVRECAKKAISRIRGWRNQASQQGGRLIDGTKVDGSITIRAHHVEPDMKATLSWLDGSVQDDRIIASVLTVEAEHPAARVVLVSGDINLQNKADAALIETANTP